MLIVTLKIDLPAVIILVNLPIMWYVSMTTKCKRTLPGTSVLKLGSPARSLAQCIYRGVS